MDALKKCLGPRGHRSCSAGVGAGRGAVDKPITRPQGRRGSTKPLQAALAGSWAGGLAMLPLETVCPTEMRKLVGFVLHFLLDSIMWN